MRYLLVGLAALTLLASACGVHKPSAEEQAVRAAINDHLSHQRGLALNNMKTQFKSVTIQGDTAHAEVRFQSIAKPDLAVGMNYTLKRVNGKWQVESSTPEASMGPDSHQHPETSPTPAPPAPAATGQPKPAPSH